MLVGQDMYAFESSHQISSLCVVLCLPDKTPQSPCVLVGGEDQDPTLSLVM